MNEAQKEVYDLLENYFFNCEIHGHSSFKVWCSDIRNPATRELLSEIVEEVDWIADKIFN